MSATNPTVAAQRDEMAELKRVEAEEQRPHEQESAALGKVRARQRQIADEEITRVIRSPSLPREEQLRRLDELSQEADDLAAQERKLTARVEALSLRASAAKAARANAEAPILVERSAAVAAQVERAAEYAVKALDAFINARSEYMQVLRDSTVHVGSVVGAPGFTRLSGFAAAFLRIVEDARGVSRG